MRKFLLAMLALGLATAAGAQELRLMISGPTDMVLGLEGYESAQGDLAGTYEPCFKDYGVSTPLIGLEYSHNIYRGIMLGASLSYFHGYDSIYDPVEEEVLGERSINHFFLLATARKNWYDKHDLQIYSALGLGIKLSHFSPETGSSELKTFFAGEVSFLGIQYGRRVAVFADLTYGNTSFVYRGGLAIKF